MKKLVVSVLAVGVLAGCSNYYDYYQGGVKYTQDGADCVYYVGEAGRHFSSDIRSLDSTKKIVYRNTRCADLYARDSFGMAERHDRQILVPVSHRSVSSAKSCGCNSCKRSKYVLLSD